MCASLAVALGGCADRRADSVIGAGATFPAPVYGGWAQAYHDATGIAVNYQPIGSGGGIRQITAGTVDFGATDKPLSAATLAKLDLSQFPLLIGGIVPIINVRGIGAGQIRLTGDVLAAIYLGQITRWTDPAIQRLNPALVLPDLPITVVHRADGSGTTFVFTSYLARKSAAWATTVGAGDAVNWKAGLGGKGNDGVAAFVKQTNGAIGYVEFTYASKSHLAYALVQNASGAFVAPDIAAFAAAAAAAPWGKVPGNAIVLVDQPDPAAWPISAATFILMKRRPDNPARSATVLRFFDWAFRTGDATAIRLSYVPLPSAVKDLIRHQWASEIASTPRPVAKAR